MNLTTEFESIRNWAEERGLYTNGTIESQFDKLEEEVLEIKSAILFKDKEEFIDGIGDAVVVLTNLAHLGGVTIEECINSAYNVIKNRKGKMIDGAFVRD